MRSVFLVLLGVLFVGCSSAGDGGDGGDDPRLGEAGVGRDMAEAGDATVPDATPSTDDSATPTDSFVEDVPRLVDGPVALDTAVSDAAQDGQAPDVDAPDAWAGGPYLTVAGTFNEWDLAAADARLAGDGNAFAGEVELPFGEIELKFAVDGAWDVNYGAGDEAAHAPRSSGLLADGPNIRVAVPVAGRWRFEVDVAEERFALTFAGEASAAQQALLDGIEAGVAPDIEAPVVAGGDVVFFSPVLAGIGADFQDWEAAAMVPTGGEMVYAPRALEPASLYHYKLIEGDVWHDDPRNPHVAWDSIERPGLGDFNSVVYTEGYIDEIGRLERFRFASETLGNTRDVFVWLSPRWIEGDASAPALYVHDGNESITRGHFDLALHQAYEAQLIAPIAVVFIALADQDLRFAEYTYSEAGGLADEYADAVALELVPIIEARYPRIEAHPDWRGITGASLGGLVSFHAAWRHPAVWHRIGGQSSSFFWADNEMISRWGDGELREGLRFYLDSGSPADNHDVTVLMVDALRDRGYLDLRHVVDEGAVHDWIPWGERFGAAVAWLFPR